MSSTNKTTSRGGKGNKAEIITKSQKSDKNDTSKAEKNKSGKGGDKYHSQQTDSARNTKLKDQEDPVDQIRKIIELTECKEEDACFALHESDFDITRAINMVLEKPDEQDWFLSVKKKKNRQQSGTKTEAVEGATEDWDSPPIHTGNEKEKTRGRTGGGPPRMHGRGWRGRESRENEKNLEDSNRPEGPRRGRMPNGPSRGSGRGGRGGGRLGSRTFQSRDSNNRNTFSSRTVDTWNSATVVATEENWNDDFPVDDWYNEEYTGSLADTKVFTPSTVAESKEDVENSLTAGDVVNMGSPQESPSSTQQLAQALELCNQQPPTATVHQPGQPHLPTQQSPIPMGVGALTTSQSQYLSQLTQQSSDNMKAQGVSAVYSPPVQPYNNSAGNYNTNYSAVTNYTNIQEQANVQQSMPTRTKTQRARVPPPSKIPASAVEMPGDLNSSVGYLDVEFGALDFMTDSATFEAMSESKFTNNNSGLDNTSAPTTNMDLSTVSQPSAMDSFTSTPPKSVQPQSSITSALSQSQMLSNSDSIPQQSGEHMSTVSVTYAPSRSTVSGTIPPVVSATALDVGKTADVGHTYSQPQTNSYQSYGSQKTNNSVYQSQNYNSNNYQNSTQVTPASSYVSNPSTNSYVNSNSGSYNNPNAVNSYQNNSYSSTSSYQTGTAAFPSITQPGTFPSNNQSTYQQSASQSVYGGNTGLSNSSNYNVTSSNQYNNYNTSSTSSHNHKISSGKEQSYDSTTTVSSTATTATSSVNASPALGLTNSQTSSNTAATKVSSSTTGKNSVINIPPGVAAPMMGTQYIMGQAGMPFYQQPVYSYEDLQLLQQRVPPHMGAYYDMGYQAPTTLATAREGSIASGAYSMSDSRFTRTDNNASPVPSTLSQQTSTQSHQGQPMLTATMPPGYAYFYNAGMMPGGFAQYGTPAIYPQMPAATNAHGSTNLNQYPKPSTYGSGYASGYDTLAQSQDYTKSGYVSGTQTQNKSGGVGTSAVTTGSSVATDLSVMYGKTHAALGKVNSYEKQGLHSGTPPPFNFAGNQSAGIAPSGTYPQMYIPTLPHQQHHSTTLMHQPLHQMDMRHQTRRMDSGNSSGQRSQTSSQAKSGAKQNYPNSYWNQA